MTKTRSQFILYLCPVGPLADQIERFFIQTKTNVGENMAHAYMPHCTLTGFFWDESAHALLYLPILKNCFDDHSLVSSDVRITHLVRQSEFIGLEIVAPKIKPLVEQFAQGVKSPGLYEVIRQKDWLHLSLAYGFPAEHFATLDMLAGLVDVNTPVGWELRFYERNVDYEWSLHWSARLPRV